MKYPKTGEEVYVSLNLSNTMLEGIGKGTITRENVSVDYLKDLFGKHGVIVSCKPEQLPLMRRMSEQCGLPPAGRRQWWTISTAIWSAALRPARRACAPWICL